MGIFIILLLGCEMGPMQTGTEDIAASDVNQPPAEDTRALPFPIDCNIPAFPMPLGATRTFYAPYKYSYVKWDQSPGLQGVYGGTVTIGTQKYHYVSYKAVGTGTQTIYCLQKYYINGTVVDELLSYKSFPVNNIIYASNPKEIVMGTNNQFSAVYDSQYTYTWRNGYGIYSNYGGYDSAQNRIWVSMVGSILGKRTFYLQRTYNGSSISTSKIESIAISVNVVQFGPLPIITYPGTPPQYTGTTVTYSLSHSILGASSYEWVLDTQAYFGQITPASNGRSCDLYIYPNPYFYPGVSTYVYLKVRGIAASGETTAWISLQVPWANRYY